MNTPPWRKNYQKIRCSLKYFKILLNYVQYCPFLDFADTYDEAYATFGVGMWRFLSFLFLLITSSERHKKIPYYFLD